MAETQGTRHVVVVAGRRIDPEPAETPRFPFDRVPEVERALSGLMDEIGVSVLVASAACGADLLALKTAAEKGIPTLIILPFDEKAFKTSSVTDRPRAYYWGALFDAAVRAARARGEIIDLGRDESDAASYLAVNKVIIDTALSLAKPTGIRPVAIVIWEGKARDGVDVTDEFRKLAEAAGFEIRIISTMREH